MAGGRIFRTTLALTIAAVCLSGATIAQAETDPLAPAVLRNRNGVQAEILPVGAIIHRLLVPDANGKADDIVLGFDDAKTYERYNSPYFGGIVGRVANRVQNGTFELDGQRYILDKNDHGNTLHGGFNPFFENNTWTVEEASDKEVKLSLFSPTGTQGFPGNLNVTATYSLNDDNVLQLVIEATTDKTTPVNLAQHSYFNLNGQARDNVLNHVVYINGLYVTPTDLTQIPNGELAAVKGTPFDFTTPHSIGERIRAVTFPPPIGGYDHNWALFGLGTDAASKTFNSVVSEEPQLAASVYSPQSGRAMDLSTNAPGLQFYSGNFLNGSVAGKGAYSYPQYGGFAMESQVWPDFVNKPSFPQSILSPGQLYRHVWSLKFYNHTAAPAPGSVQTTSLP
ncbi:aldose 1-epimerase [Coccomyxa subellipsoidea C-169]|uniref:Aldose 1-epimerase n=1 Tax=Coccomyxa subellipsoidea (strain C-169) TaxID=574566 RepID=I0YKG2_COCSC|nr:aldose 1-epimerase [Coccomyxa subellipsoidea C-169]EIE18881.1 aldose 1-epimerase [Coccomyxa subellipsoidea C-169]|eukprot:XP_005643425.1 aldose 1-epimerase [Coccomyxa subellipsoidea C-169]